MRAERYKLFIEDFIMMKIKIFIEIGKSQEAESNVVQTRDLLKEIYKQLTRVNWTYVLVFFQCIDWLVEHINQLI